MTALDRALAWFLEPPAPDPSAAPGEPDAARDRAQTTWLRPVADPFDSPAAPPPDGRAVAPAALDDPPPAAGPTLGARGAASGALDDPSPAARPMPGRRGSGSGALDDSLPAAHLARGGRGAASASLEELPLAGRGFAARRPVGCAAVLGRPGHAEPVAAALALALSAGAQARAATVVVLGPADHAPRGHADPERDGPSAGGGTRAARRLADRLDAHGLPGRPRGRLVWVELPSEGRQAAARRAALVGPPAVLAVTAARAPDIEELLAEQDLLLLVMADPAGPLARIAALAPGGVPVAVTRPLARGPARSLALAGISAPRSIRGLAAGHDAAATEPEAA
jgi:hypothetical protein